MPEKPASKPAHAPGNDPRLLEMPTDTGKWAVVPQTDKDGTGPEPPHAVGPSRRHIFKDGFPAHPECRLDRRVYCASRPKV
jgi:hypothetical protein